MKKKTRPQISSIVEELHEGEILLDDREVFLHGYISSDAESSETDFRMACRFLKNLRLLENIRTVEHKDQPIVVHQFNPGGCWNSGMMIYDAIESCSVPVYIICHGVAASMGSIIPQAADQRICMPNCEWLIHDGKTGIHPEMDHRKAQSWAELERRYKEEMLDIYTEVCKDGKHFEFAGVADEADVRRYIEEQMEKRADWFLTAREAVEFGFADAVLGDEGYETLNDIKKLECTEN